MSEREGEVLAEGPEAPPRGVGAMAVVRWVILLAVTALAVVTVWRAWGPGAGAPAAQGPARYYCPMHPQIRSPDPGECPICHMNLEPIPVERTQPTGPMSAALQPDAGPAEPHAHGPASAGLTAPDGGEALSELVPVNISLERQQLVGVVTEPVTRRQVGDTLRAPGVVEAPEGALSEVHVRAPGFLERLEVRETGVQVARGQVLAWVYSPQVYQAQRELLTARRWGAAGGSGSVGGGEHSHAPSEPEAMARAARESLLLLGMTEGDIEGVLRRGEPLRAIPVRAPRGGYVTRRNAVLGMYAMPETVLYEVAGLAEVWVVASLYAHDLERVRRGQAARFTVAGGEPGGYEARVALVEPRIGEETRTARVRLTVQNPGLRLRPGQYGDVELTLSSARALAVPRDAVIDTGRAQYVFVALAEGRFEPRAVRLGSLSGEYLEVREGLREGERVVARGAFMLDSEARLQAALTASPAGDAGGAAP